MSNPGQKEEQLSVTISDNTLPEVTSSNVVDIERMSAVNLAAQDRVHVLAQDHPSITPIATQIDTLANTFAKEQETVNQFLSNPDSHSEAQNPANLSLVAIAQHRMEEQPGRTVAELMDLSEEEIRGLSTPDYARYLGAITHIDAPELILKNLTTIADRFEAALQELSAHEDHDAWELSMDIGEHTEVALDRLVDAEGLHIPPQILERLYAYSGHENSRIRFHATEYLQNLVLLDTRNSVTGNRIGLYDKYHSLTINTLVNPQNDSDQKKARALVGVAYMQSPGEFHTMLIDSIQAATTPEAMQRIAAEFGNRMGFAEMRALLREDAKATPGLQEKLDEMDTALRIAQGKGFNDLRKLYREIVPQFKEYKPNAELNAYETELIIKEAKGAIRVLDIGFGTGRLLQSLKEKGVNVYGFDFVPEFVQAVKQEDSESKVSLASWYDMPIKDKSIKVAYCFGRSFLHNPTVESGIKMLEEAHRVLEDDGVLLIDKPKNTEGHYAQEREKMAGTLEESGVYNYEEGFIHDSPDGEHYFDRLSPMDEQFKAMAALAGFEADITEEKEFTDQEGNKSTNVYWRLKKRGKPLTFDELLNADSEAHTDRFPLKEYMDRY